MLLHRKNESQSVSVAPPENPAPLQQAGSTFTYNFDGDGVGLLLKKFHSARTGQGPSSQWVVLADSTAPSKPNVVAQTSVDTTDYRFPLLVVAGRRRPLGGANLEVTSQEWHELRVECVGNRIICYYDGMKKIEAADDTFQEAGKVALWTKADSVTYFDDFRVIAK